jgi:hypothetical protein
MCSHRVADSLPIDISFSNMNQVCVCVDLKLPVNFLQFVWRNSAMRKFTWIWTVCNSFITDDGIVN